MTAKSTGPCTWAIEPEDDDDARQAAMEKEIGPALMQISAWVGERAAAGDKKSIAMMVDHVAAVLDAGKEVILKKRHLN
jgi:hypothetical protein